MCVHTATASVATTSTFWAAAASFPLASLDPPVLAALIAAASALLLAVLRALASLFSAARDRRRELYGRAYRDAMAWVETLYRIRRRASGPQAERELVERFHDLQERIDYHRGWLGSESRYLAHSYCQLVLAIKRATEPLIQVSWQQPPRSPGGPAPAEERHPHVEAHTLRFLTDVRLHLSLWPLLPLARLAWRNREEEATDNQTRRRPTRTERKTTNDA